MSKTVDIGYLSSTDQDYSLAIRKAKTLKELREVTAYYMPLTADALKLASKMTEQKFQKWLKDIPKLSRAQGKTAERIVGTWGDLILPKEMLRISMIANQFNAPFGTAYIRDKEIRESKK